MIGRSLEAGAGLKLQVQVVQRREGADTGLHAHGFARDQASLHPALDPGRQIAGDDMLEGRVDLFLTIGQGDPRLDAFQTRAFAASAFETLRVGHAAARGHPVDLGRPDVLLHAQAVAVRDLALEQIGQGRDADVRVGTHVDRLGQARRHVHRPHVVEEGEGADHTALGERQDAADLKAAEILAALVDDEFDHIDFPGVRNAATTHGGDPRTMARIAPKVSPPCRRRIGFRPCRRFR